MNSSTWFPSNLHPPDLEQVKWPTRSPEVIDNGTITQSHNCKNCSRMQPHISLCKTVTHNTVQLTVLIIFPPNSHHGCDGVYWRTGRIVDWPMSQKHSCKESTIKRLKTQVEDQLTWMEWQKHYRWQCSQYNCCTLSVLTKPLLYRLQKISWATLNIQQISK